MLAVRARAQVTVGGTHCVDRETKARRPGRYPRASAMATWAPGDRQDGAREPRGEGGAKGGRREAGRPRSRTYSRCAASPPGIQKMPTHHTHHQHHHHVHLHIIDPDAGDLIPPQPPQPQHQPAPPAPRAEPVRMAAAPAAGGRGAAPAPQAQGPQGELVPGAEGARPLGRDWVAVPDPLGGEALPLVVDVLRVAELGLLGDHQGDEVPAPRSRAPPEGRGEPGGAPGGLGRPRGPRESPPGGDLGGVAQQGADVDGFPRGRGSAPHHRCGCQQLAPPGLTQRPHPLALPPAEPAAATAPALTQATTQVTAAPRRPRR